MSNLYTKLARLTLENYLKDGSKPNLKNIDSDRYIVVGGKIKGYQEYEELPL